MSGSPGKLGKAWTWKIGQADVGKIFYKARNGGNRFRPYLFVRIRCILNFDNFDAGIVVE